MIKNWLIPRLRQPSTWRGIVWLLTACGISLKPEAWEFISTIGMAAAGLLGVLTDDAPSLPPIELQARPEAPARLPDRNAGNGAVVGDDRRPGAVDNGVRVPASRRPGQDENLDADPPAFSAGFGDRD